jgi:peptidoglycan hydrolase-like protein with peptidoglycan-binding domain
MKTHLLNAIALPAGAAGDGAGMRVSVLLSPRLSGADHLADFADWRDWTGLAAGGLELRLSVGGASASVAADVSQLRPTLWRAIFARGAAVEAYEPPNWDERLIVSYPALLTAAALARFYGTQALMPAAGVTSRTLAPFRFPADGEPLNPKRRALLRAQAWRRQQHPAGATLAAPPAGAGAIGMLPPGVRPEAVIEAVNPSFHLFHSLPPAPGRPPLPKSRAERAKLLDFHAAVAALAAHPELMRALGLVLDLEFPLDDVPGLSAGEVPIAVEDVLPSDGWQLAPRLLHPTTACALELDGREVTHFAAASTPGAAGDVVDGFLSLVDDFGLVPVDIDGAMLSLTAAAESTARSADDGGLPTLRSGGLALVASDRAEQLLEQLKRSSAYEKAFVSEGGDGEPPAPLRSIDLVRGFRIDIWSSDTGRWHSLHQRGAMYQVGDGSEEFTVKDGEGFVQLAVTQAANDPTRSPDPPAGPNGPPPSDTDLYLHERVARWAGWSLSVPRPEQALHRDANPHVATSPDNTEGEPVTPFKLVIDKHVIPRTLPRLRFGSRYRLRVRAVDLAGNGPRLGDGEAADDVLPAGGGSFPYLRFEPSPPPLVVLRDTLETALGGSLYRMVIRTRNLFPADDDTPTTDASERHIAPPRGSVELAERHRQLDRPGGGLDDRAQTFAKLAQRDAAQLPTSPDGIPSVPEASFDIPYLPDPIVVDAVLLGLPGSAEGSRGDADAAGLTYALEEGIFPRAAAVTRVPFTGSWPNQKPFRLVLAEGTEPPGWDPSSRELSLGLPKGAVVTVDLAGGFDADELELLGLWSWVEQAAEASRHELLTRTPAGPDLGPLLNNLAATLGASAQAAIDGAHPMLSPPHQLTLVHAVQRPLASPRLVAAPSSATASPAGALEVDPPAGYRTVAAWRALDAHDAYLIGALELHGASTAKVDLEATWTDLVDDPELGPNTRIPRAGHADELRLDSLSGAAPLRAPGADERATGWYLPDADAIWFANEGDVLGQLAPRARAAPRHDFGDTRRHLVTYRPIATSRFREYFEEGADVSRPGETHLVDVPSSSRPATPLVRYAIPTFGWERSETDDSRVSMRRGRGLRLFLDLPWWSSGEGELLGVTLWPSEAAPPTNDERQQRKSEITQWGLDPTWATQPPVHKAPVYWEFPARAADATGLELPTGGVVDVAGHEVGFDDKRNLRFCDIELETFETYSPMVRLALARFQPHAIPGCELSSPVLADVIQPAPDRTVTVVRDPIDTRRLAVAVAGIGPAAPRRSVISVTVQRRDPSIESDLAWSDAPDGADVIVDSVPDDADAVLWMGTVRVRTDPTQLRLVIREEEQLLADPAVTVLDQLQTRDLGRLVVFDRAQRAGDTERARRRETSRFRATPSEIIGITGMEPSETMTPPSQIGRVVFLETIPLDLAHAPDPTGTGSDGPAEPLSDPTDPPWAPITEPADAAGIDVSSLPSLPASLADADGHVKLVQALVNAAGVALPLSVDGLLGPFTAAAVTAFQTIQGLSATGAVDSETWLRLLPLTALAQLEPGSGDPPMTGSSVAVVQRLLNLAGADPRLPMTGVYDDATGTAVAAFQQRRGISQTAVVDPETWRHLQTVPTEVAPNGCLRLVLALDASQTPPVTVLAVNPTGEPPPTSDSTAPRSGALGWWVEWHDMADVTIHRRLLQDPFRTQEEAVAGADGRFDVSEAPATAGTAEILVPDLPLGAVLVLFGSLDPTKPADELASFRRLELTP